MKFLFVALSIFFATVLSAEMDIKYRFLAGSISVSKNVKQGDVSGLAKIIGSKYFNPKLKLIIYVHGYTHYCQSRGAKPVLDAMTKFEKNTNYLFVDYSAYTCAFKENPTVLTNEIFDDIAAAVYQTLSNLRELSGGFPHIYAIGFGVGGFIVNSVGLSFKENEEYQLDRATILDPSSEFIQQTFTRIQLDFDERITKECAKFVDVIHTNGGGSGKMESLGHVDFYVNGGRFQPKCQDAWKIAGYLLLDPIKCIACDHQLAWEYYMETVSSLGPTFIAYKCPVCYDAYTETTPIFDAATCTEKTELQMGFHADKVGNNPSKYGCYFVPISDEV